jgi:hypothetical protein
MQLQSYLVQFNFSLLDFIFLVVSNIDSIASYFIAKISFQILIKPNQVYSIIISGSKNLQIVTFSFLCIEGLAL